jgi:ABC-type bacteriocin/lantibiotic exporter with double-glycine peptidase domain
MILPFLSVLSDPDRIFSHDLAQPLIRFFNLYEPNQLILPLTIIFATAALVAGALRMTLLWAQTRLCHAVGADLSISIYRRTLYQPYSVQVARNSSEVIAGISFKANSIVSYTIFPLVTISSSSMLLLITLIWVVSIEPVAALAIFAGFGAIYLLVIILTKKRLEHDSHRLSREQNQALKNMQEGLGGIRDILIDGNQNVFCDIYRQTDLSLRRAAASVQIISIIPRHGIEALGMVVISALVLSLASRPDGFLGAIPVLGVLVLSAQRLLPALQQVFSSLSYFRGGQVTLRDALDLLDQPLPKYADAPITTPIPFKYGITLEKLEFRYSFDAKPVLRNLDLIIPKGGRIGFIGPTGSGKSTLLDVIMGLLHPTGGSLIVDEEVITMQNHRAWQAHISHVPQAIFLADTSVAENIAFGVPHDKIDHGRVRQAAQKAQIAETIENWDEKYGTLVGERGIRLSGGQRQRIGIARALYKNARVIVFDEATSALDSDTERAVMQSIEDLGPEYTILIIAHRLTTLKKCTQIVELSEGSIKRIGTYEDTVGRYV